MILLQNFISHSLDNITFQNLNQKDREDITNEQLKKIFPKKSLSRILLSIDPHMK